MKRTIIRRSLVILAAICLAGMVYFWSMPPGDISAARECQPMAGNTSNSYTEVVPSETCVHPVVFLATAGMLILALILAFSPFLVSDPALSLGAEIYLREP